MGDQETKKVPRLRYVDVDDRKRQEYLQDPRMQFLWEDPADWPDQILLAELPQVSENQIDAPIVEIVGRCEGPIRNTRSVTIVPTDVSITFFRPKSTKFVRVVREGMERMERWNFDKHGEWEQIPDTGLTPPQLIERLYGFGNTAVEQGQQFNLTRKRKASKTSWKAGNHPSPRVRGLWKNT